MILDPAAVHPSVHLSVVSLASHFEYIWSGNESWTACGWTAEYEREEGGRKRRKRRRRGTKQIHGESVAPVIMAFLLPHGGGKWSFPLKSRPWWMVEYVCRNKSIILHLTAAIKMQQGCLAPRCWWSSLFMFWPRAEGVHGHKSWCSFARRLSFKAFCKLFYTWSFWSSRNVKLW